MPAIKAAFAKCYSASYGQAKQVIVFSFQQGLMFRTWRLYFITIRSIFYLSNFALDPTSVLLLAADR